MVVMVVHASLLRLSCFSPMDLAQQVFLSLLEEFVSELPSVWHNLSETLVDAFKINHVNWKNIKEEKKEGIEEDRWYVNIYIGVELANET